jgi:hypothetical protein
VRQLGGDSGGKELLAVRPCETQRHFECEMNGRAGLNRAGRNGPRLWRARLRGRAGARQIRVGASRCARGLTRSSGRRLACRARWLIRRTWRRLSRPDACSCHDQRDHCSSHSLSLSRR